MVGARALDILCRVFSITGLVEQRRASGTISLVDFDGKPVLSDDLLLLLASPQPPQICRLSAVSLFKNCAGPFFT